MQNLQICGLGFIVLSIMYYLLIDVFEKSKRLRQNAMQMMTTQTEQPAKIAPVRQVSSLIEAVAPAFYLEGVYPMYVDCTLSQRIIPPHSNSALTPATI